MKYNKQLFASNLIFCVIFSFLTFSQTIMAQVKDREIPKEWDKLVEGGKFRDLFLPMSDGKKIKRPNWGADGVIDRFVDNGIEDQKNSFWGGNIKFSDGLFHLFVCGWPESSAKGHMAWPGSTVYHATSKKINGPYKIADTIGKGHNPEIFQAKDGSFVIYVIDGAYRSKTLKGPWTYEKLYFDNRDRPIIEGLSNLTFAKREDGSQLMICRGGGVWFSETGVSPYMQVSNQRVYPSVEGEFEDPVVWKDHIQYHLIVNDWLGRIAYYQRSPDGVNWVTDPGQAYTIGIAEHKDGNKEAWYKFERIKIFQDKYGRAISSNFAVIDTNKWEDKANDKYSSKNIVIPLTKSVLLEFLNPKLPSADEEIKILVKAENGFDPNKDLDLTSLRFGTNQTVNYGGGSQVVRTEKVKAGLILTFSNHGHNLNHDEFAPKLLGKRIDGKLLFGYTRVPWAKYEKGILSAKKPMFLVESGKSVVKMEVQNFGVKPSSNAKIKLYQIVNGKTKILAERALNQIKPYEKELLSINLKEFVPSEEYSIIIDEEGSKLNEWRFKMND